MNTIDHPNLITYQDWVTIKTADLTYGYKNFNSDDIDAVCVYYDANGNYMDWNKIREFENKEPNYVLVPKFFWEAHQHVIHDEFMPGISVQSRIDRLKEFEDQHRNQINSRTEGVFGCDIVPRPEQVPLLDALVEHFETQGRIRGVVAAAPGFGKTISSVKTISNLKSLGIIIVPNEVLSDQWQEAILNFSDLTLDDIAIIEGSDSIKIKQEIHEKKIAIVKIQSLYSQLKRIPINELSAIYNEFNVAIYDECHTSGAAEGYAKTSSIFTTPNIIGMSATPYRDGLNDYLLKISIGETIYKSDHKNLIPDVEMYALDIEFSPREIQRLQSVRMDFIMFLSIFNMILAGKQTYFDYLADWVNYNQSIGHNIVVLFSTNKMVQRLKDTIVARHPHLNTEKLLTLTGTTKKDAQDIVKDERKRLMDEYKLFKADYDQQVKDKKIKRKDANEIVKAHRADLDLKIQDMKDNALALYKTKIKDAQQIISNYNLLSAGFDKPELSNIIYGSPRIGKVSVIQSLGRVTRIYDGKLKPFAQFMLPKVFLEFQKSTSIILSKNIRIEYDSAKIVYTGFDKINSGEADATKS